MDTVTISPTGLQFLWPIILASFFVLLSAIYNRRRPKGFPPGPLSLPVLGNLHQLGQHPFKTFMVMRKEYGDVFAVDFASYRGVIINGTKLIREAFALPEFSGRPTLRPFLERYGGEMRGVIINDGQSWTEHRRFTLKTLRDFGFGKASMESLVQDEIDEVLVMYSKSNGEPFQGKHLFNLISLNTLWMMITGERFSYEDKKLTELSNIFADGVSDAPAAGAMFFFPTLSRLAPNLTGYNSFMNTQFETLALIKQKYREQKATFQSGKARHFMDIYIQQHIDEKDPNSTFYGETGEEHMLASIADLFMAGIETTGTTMSFGFLLLILNPKVQEKMYEEIESVIGDSRMVSLDDRASLPYSEAVLTEIFRHSSIFPLGVFHAATEDVLFQNYHIPKGTMIVPNLYGVHHDPEIWGDPENFRPERFMTPDGKLSPARNDNILAFSSGKRVCIGEIMARSTLFLILARVVQQFKILANPSKPFPTLDFIPSLVMQTKPYEYILEKRMHQ